MNETQTVSVELPEVKICNGQRVVTFKDIDTVHQRTDGTARRTFNKNKKHFIKDVDYFVRNSSEAKSEYGIVAPNGLTVLTESGYLMIVKSFTDDLSWDVQRRLVNSYFQAKQEQQPALPEISEWDMYMEEHKFDREKRIGAWFTKNNWKLKIILENYGWTRKFLYHKILVELSDFYDLEAEQKMYRLTFRHPAKYMLDLLDSSKEMAHTATKYINYLLLEED